MRSASMMDTRILSGYITAAADSLKECAFALECVAHLQGKEKLFLPIAERARKLASGLTIQAKNAGVLDK